jgi:RNA polymerase sigma-70 factor, ECF subfamily
VLEDKRLVWLLKRGHREAAARIYRRHKDHLVTLATCLLIDRSEAEDVVHDVFLAFLRSAGTFRLTGTLRGFLATCVANGARNRNKVMRRRAPGEGGVVEGPAPELERPDLAAVFGDELRRVGEALAALPYEQREVVLLRLQGGLRFRAIAQIQEVSVNTVQGRYRYGLGRLRELLDGER